MECLRSPPEDRCTRSTDQPTLLLRWGEIFVSPFLIYINIGMSVHPQTLDDVYQWNRNPLIRENISPQASSPLGVQEYPCKIGVTPHVMTIVVLSLPLHEDLSL